MQLEPDEQRESMIQREFGDIDVDEDSTSMILTKEVSPSTPLMSSENDEADVGRIYNEEFFLKKKTKLYYPPNASFEEKCDQIKKQLQSEYLCWSLKRRIKGELIKSKYNIAEIKTLLPTIMKQNHFTTLLQNEIFRLHRIALSNHEIPEYYGETVDQDDLPDFPQDEETLDPVKSARYSWGQFVKDQLLSISSQLGYPLSQTTAEHRARLAQTGKRKKKIKDDGIEIEEFEDDLPKYTGVYSSAKLFETCLQISNPNHQKSVRTLPGWGLIKLELRTYSKKEMREMFPRLDPECKQVGLDDYNSEWFTEDSVYSSKKVVSTGHLPAICHYAQVGIPASMRPKFWKYLLDVASTDRERVYYDSLLRDVANRRLLIDDMVHNDVKRTSDDENYFIFEENIDSIMICFSRDAQVYEKSAIKPIALMSMVNSNNTGIPYPPSGVIPFEGLSLMASPFCYLYNKQEDMYFAFRNCYIKHFCKLHTISSKPESLLHLCKTFEDLLQHHDPQLFYHLLEMGIQPLEIAFNWIYHAFAGYLSVDQLLLLWDRMLGFSNLYLLPVLAVAIFSFRSKFLMRVDSKQEVYDVFSDFTVIKTVPLLQIFLFS